MAGIVESFKQGYEGRDSGRFTVAGRPVACPHCGGDTFEASYAMLNTRGLTFLGLDFVNREASVLTCKTCSRIEWFADEPTAL